MAITTTDVVTNVVSGVEVAKNATCVVFCQRTGEYESFDSTYDVSISYDGLEAWFTDRFDDVNYYAGGAGE